MQMIEQDTYWYVVYTLPRWEKKVARLLDEKGYAFYCPLVKREKKWSDRIKIVEEPLFKGYVFVQVTEEKKWAIRDVQGVINFVHWLGKPAKVKQDEIDTIKKFLQEFDEVMVCEPGLQTNDRVVIRQGVFMNFNGMIVEVNGSSAKVKIQSIGVELTAVFKKNNLEFLQRQNFIQ